MTFFITAPPFSDKSIELLTETATMLTQVPNAIAQLQTLLQTAEDERIEVADALGGLQSQITTLSGNVATLTEENQSQGQALQTQAETIAALQEALESQGVDISAFQGIINSLTQQNTTLQEANTSLTGQMTQVESMLGIAIDKVESIYTNVSTPGESGDSGNPGKGGNSGKGDK